MSFFSPSPADSFVAVGFRLVITEDSNDSAVFGESDSAPASAASPAAQASRNAWRLAVAATTSGSFSAPSSDHAR